MTDHTPDYDQAEIDLRRRLVQAAKDRARARGFLAPTLGELTAALGDEFGVSATARVEDRARRRGRRTR
jgi:hypothetical protein